VDWIAATIVAIGLFIVARAIEDGFKTLAGAIRATVPGEHVLSGPGESPARENPASGSPARR
jgi:hypothetical protein